MTDQLKNALPRTSSTQAPADHPSAGVSVTLTVRVTDEDILLGIRGDGRECPIARATRRALVLLGSPRMGVVVGASHRGYACVSVNSAWGHEAMYQFCPDGWLHDFDDGRPVQPRTFELVLLDRVDQPIPYSLTGKQS